MSSEQEPIEVRLVRRADGLLCRRYQLGNPLYAWQSETAAWEYGRAHAPAAVEDWTLVPSAVRAAEQERLRVAQERLQHFETAAAKVRADIDGIIPEQAHRAPRGLITRWVHALRAFVGYQAADNPIAQEAVESLVRLAAFEALAKKCALWQKRAPQDARGAVALTQSDRGTVFMEDALALAEQCAALAPPAPPEGEQL